METTDKPMATEVPAYKARLEELCRTVQTLYQDKVKAMVLHRGPSERAYLHVVNSDNDRIFEDIGCRPMKNDELWFWWGWGDSIGPVEDMASVARVIGNVLMVNRM